MIQCLERKVFIFNPKETPPEDDDTFDGFILALTEDGMWTAETAYWVRNNPWDFRAWMQYPDLSKHIEEFSNKS